MDVKITCDDHAIIVTMQKKIGENIRSILKFFPLPHSNHRKLREVACTPGDHAPVYGNKLTRKWKFVWILGFFFHFYPQLVATTGDWDRLLCIWWLYDHGTSECKIINQKIKVGQNNWFFHDFFPHLILPTENKVNYCVSHNYFG